MRVFARTIGALGLLLVLAGIFGPITGLTDIGVVPGMLLLFMARVVSKQAKRAEREAEGREPPQRVLNTERTSATAPRLPVPEPSQPPRPVRPPSPPPPPKTAPPEPAAAEPGTGEKESIFDSILLAGSELASEKETDVEDQSPSGPGHKSSGDMIADARKRWGQRP